MAIAIFGTQFSMRNFTGMVTLVKTMGFLGTLILITGLSVHEDWEYRGYEPHGLPTWPASPPVAINNTVNHPCILTIQQITDALRTI